MKRLLLVEDGSAAARTLERLAADRGLVLLGPVTDFGAAVVRACEPGLAGAVLGTRLGPDDIWPLADLLRSRNVPFVFMAAEAPARLPERFRDVPCLDAACAEGDMRSAIASIARDRPGGGLSRADPSRETVYSARDRPL